MRLLLRSPLVGRALRCSGARAGFGQSGLRCEASSKRTAQRATRCLAHGILVRRRPAMLRLDHARARRPMLGSMSRHTDTWEALMSDYAEVRGDYLRRGFANRIGLGARPAVLVVDLTSGFTDPTTPLGADLSEVIAATNRIPEIARAAAMPVIFTSIACGDPVRRRRTLGAEDPGTRDPEGGLAARRNPSPPRPAVERAGDLRSHRAPSASRALREQVRGSPRKSAVLIAPRCRPRGGPRAA